MCSGWNLQEVEGMGNTVTAELSFGDKSFLVVVPDFVEWPKNIKGEER